MNPPPPFRIIRPSRASIKYEMTVIQNPDRARCCGFGDKDRRPIDPPAIVQLRALDDDKEIEISSADSMLFTVQCDLYSEDTIEPRNLVYPPGTTSFPLEKDEKVIDIDTTKSVRNLVGSVVSNAYELKNLADEVGTFFIFNDLSVRTEGVFTLRFLFSDLGSGEPLSMSTQVQSECFSEPFTVYSAKKFIGMSDTTEITKKFADQGVKILTRRQKGRLLD